MAEEFYTNVIMRGNNILYRGIENGRRVQKKIKYEPYIFIPSKKSDAEFKSIFGKPLDRMDFDSMKEARNFISTYKDVSNFEIYGMTNYVYPFINDKFRNDIHFDRSKINIGNVDIEVSSKEGFPNPDQAKYPITAITIKRNSLIVSLGCGDFDAPEGVIYIKCPDEITLLEKFIEVWKKMDLDIITGWNIEGFDIPYLINRINNVLGEGRANALSPWNMIEARTIYENNREINTYIIHGIGILDYLQLYKKFTYTNREQYTLNHIAFIEIGEKKLDYSEYEGLNELYEQDFQKFMEYNIKDVLLVEKIDEKMDLLGLALSIAYSSKINYNDVFTSVKLWDVIIHNYLMAQGIAVSPTKAGFKEKFEGAYVKPPMPGLYHYPCSFDVASLYPSLIVEYNISPETLIGDVRDLDPDSRLKSRYTVEEILNGDLETAGVSSLARKHNCGVTSNGYFWRNNTEGHFPQLVRKLMAERSEYKKIMLQAKSEYEKNPSTELKNKISKYDNLQMARKIQLNSLYGAYANCYFRWYDLAAAEGITISGQFAIRWIEKNINSFLNKMLQTTDVDYVIAIDTDSVYLNMEKVVTGHFKKEHTIEEAIDFLDDVCKNIIDPKIKSYFDKLAVYTNAKTSFLSMKREALANKGIWTAKKRYILNVYNDEGVKYAEPKLKMTGIEAVRSSTPKSCRDNIKECLKVIMTKDEDAVIEFIDDFREKFKQMEFEDIAFPRSCNGLSTYADKDSIFRKSTPIQVRGALVYNDFLKNQGLLNKYDTVHEGDKILFCHLKTPNPLRQNVVSVVNTLPRALGLHNYIDFNTQFDKAFLEPLKSILDSIGWHHEKRTTLASFWE